MRSERAADRIRGFVWGAAVGDALGSRAKAGATGKQAPLQISALTQMLLFAGESLIRAFNRGNEKGIAPDFVACIDHGYARWLETQGLKSSRWLEYLPDGKYDGWLIGSAELWRTADPNTATIEALLTQTAGSAEHPANARRGSSANCSSAVAGLASRPVDDDWSRKIAQSAVRLTHGHPEAAIAGGAAAVLIRALVHEQHSWREARRLALAVATEHLDHAAPEASPFLGLADVEDGDHFGDGSTAASALGLAVRSVDRGTTFPDVVAEAIQSGGAVRTTAQLAGAIAGARRGVRFVPATFRRALVERWTVGALADDLAAWMSAPSDDQPREPWVDYRYPGW